jgi:hypothetical protein
LGNAAEYLLLIPFHAGRGAFDEVAFEKHRDNLAKGSAGGGGESDEVVGAGTLLDAGLQGADLAFHACYAVQQRLLLGFREIESWRFHGLDEDTPRGYLRSTGPSVEVAHLGSLEPSKIMRPTYLAALLFGIGAASCGTATMADSSSALRSDPKLIEVYSAPG